MSRHRGASVWGGVAVLVVAGLAVSWAEDARDNDPLSDESFQYLVEHPECAYFNGPTERFMDQTVRARLRPSIGMFRLSAATVEVTRLLSYVREKVKV